MLFVGENLKGIRAKGQVGLGDVKGRFAHFQN